MIIIKLKFTYFRLFKETIIVDFEKAVMNAI